LEIPTNALAGEEGAAEFVKLFGGFGAFVVGIVNQSEGLIAQQIFEFAGGKGCGDSCLQSGWLHEWRENMAKGGVVNTPSANENRGFLTLPPKF
jgi:hypothetical protein